MRSQFKIIIGQGSSELHGLLVEAPGFHFESSFDGPEYRDWCEARDAAARLAKAIGPSKVARIENCSWSPYKAVQERRQKELDKALIDLKQGPQEGYR